MSDPSFNLRLRRRPVRIFVGFLAGLIFGPLVAILLFHLPASEWTGPYPSERDYGGMMGLAAFIGLGYGLLVGPVIALCVRLVQHFLWGIRTPNRDWSDGGSEIETTHSKAGSAPEERIARRTDIAGSLGDGIAAAPQ